MELSKDQQKAYDSIIDGDNIFLTGKAGTGKSFVITKVIEYFKEKYKNVAILGTTGIAAQNIGGQTMHSFFKLPISGVANFDKCFYVKMDNRMIWDNTEIVIIDEVSMLRPDTLDSINWTLKKNKCEPLESKQIIFVGDLAQLPPVIKQDEIPEIEQYYGEGNYTFMDSHFVSKIDIEEICLKKIHRQTDVEFIENLNILRDGGKSDYFKKFVSEQTKGIILSPHKMTANSYNFSELKKLDGKDFISEALISGKKMNCNDFNIEEKLFLRDGAIVMHLVNNGSLVNGSIGKLSIKEERLYFVIGDERYRIKRHEFEKKEYYLHESGELRLRPIGKIIQYPLKLAYAMTIHKAQGLTFDEVTVDLTRKCFEKGQLYTAISRVRTPEGLNLII